MQIRSKRIKPSLIQIINKRTKDLLNISCLSDFYLKIKGCVSELNKKIQPIKNVTTEK